MDAALAFPRQKVGLDVDEVCAGWISAWVEREGLASPPTSWDFDPDIAAKLKVSYADPGFWEGIRPASDPAQIRFIPHCYVTNRPPELHALTADWLARHGFPAAPLYTGEYGISKLDRIRSLGLDLFVDDNPDTFEELTGNGVVCFLFDTPQNRHVDARGLRVSSLADPKLLRELSRTAV